MAKNLLTDCGALAKAICDGEHDDELDYILSAVQYRMKTRFRKGTRVRLTGTRNVGLEGKEGTVLKVNPKRISVGLGAKNEWGGYDDGEYNVPPSMLEIIA